MPHECVIAATITELSHPLVLTEGDHVLVCQVPCHSGHSDEVNFARNPQILRQRTNWKGGKRRQRKRHIRSRFGRGMLGASHRQRRRQCGRKKEESVAEGHNPDIHLTFLTRPRYMWGWLFNYFWLLDCVSLMWYCAKTGPYGAQAFIWITNEACMCEPS